MKDIDAAWLAAVIDGEGTISICKDKRKDGTVRYDPLISICNNNLDFLKKVESLVCAGGVSIKSKGVVGRKSVNYSYSVRQMDAIETTLKSIFQYLIIKRRRAEQVLELIEYKRGFRDSFVYDGVVFDSFARDAGLKGRHHLKGNRGDPEGHRRAAVNCRNNHLKGNRGRHEQHVLSGSRKGKVW